MRYLFGFLCVFALGVMPLLGCGETGGTGGGDLCQGVDCNDDNDCTDDVCDPTDGSCSNTPLVDGAFCDVGYCQSGQCEPITSVFACDEQGILDAIAAGGGPHGFDCDGPTVVETTATIVIDNDVILDGRGDLAVDGDGDHPVISLPIGVAAGLRRLAVSGGFCPGIGFQGFGSGISNEGTLDLVNCDVSQNVADDCLAGAGLGNSGTLRITNSTVSENTGEFFGGIWNLGTMELEDSTVSGNVAISMHLGVNGVFNDATFPIYPSVVGPRGVLTIARSTVSDNNGGVYGGIHNNAGAVTVTNSTVSGNAGDTSGALFNGGPPGALAIVNSTVSGNTAASGASIVNVTNAPSGGGVLTITSSAVEGDCAGYPDGAPDIASNGYNIESPDNTCGFDQQGDQPSVAEEDLNLGPLANNGGPTMTHKPGAGGFGFGSAAIDKIPEAACYVDFDQRGQPRPSTLDPMCDVGSVEVGAFEVQP